MRPTSNETGLTLLELMVVLVFISIGILALSFVQSHSLVDIHQTGRHTRALDLAEMQLETARAAGYILVQPDSGVTDGFNWRTDVDSLGTPFLRRVTTTVSWAEAGTARSVRLLTLLSSR